jgi:hypothetical protein
VAEPKINVARARMLVALAFRKQLFFEKNESKENSSCMNDATLEARGVPSWQEKEKVLDSGI